MTYSVHESWVKDGVDKEVTAESIIHEAAQTVAGRAADRDNGRERSMARAVAIFNATTGSNLCESDGWAFMLCLKMARAFNPEKADFNKDHFVDLAGYAGLLGEAWSRK